MIDMEIELELLQMERMNRDYENYSEEDFQKKSAMVDAIIADELEEFLKAKDEIIQIITDAAKFGVPILEDYHISIVTDDNTGYEFQVYNLDFRKNKIIYLLQAV